MNVVHIKSSLIKKSLRTTYFPPPPLPSLPSNYKETARTRLSPPPPCSDPTAEDVLLFLQSPSFSVISLSSVSGKEGEKKLALSQGQSQSQSEEEEEEEDEEEEDEEEEKKKSLLCHSLPRET